MISQLFPKLFKSVRPYHAPEFQGPESSSERNTPVPVIINLASCSCFEVFGKNFKCFDKGCSISYEVCRTVKVCEDPFMRIENKTVDIFFPFKHPLKFRQNKCCSGHCGINMKPYPIFSADLSYCFNRVNSSGSCCSYCSNHTTWEITHSAYPVKTASLSFSGSIEKSLPDRDLNKVFSSYTAYFNSFFN